MINRDLRSLVRGAYDLQKLRIQMGNRVVTNFKVKLGAISGISEIETLDEKSRQLLDKIRAAGRVADAVTGAESEKSKSAPDVAGEVMELVMLQHELLTQEKDNLKPKTFRGNVVISTFTELALVSTYKETLADEDKHFKRLGAIVATFPIWKHFMDGVRGLGPAMAGVILSEIDIEKASNPSKLFKYAGLDVASDGKGRSRKAEHLIDREYVDRDGKTQVKKSVTFNPFLKTKLMGVLAPCFLRSNNLEYRKIYDDYKNRLKHHAVYKDASDLHRHNMAMRYMMKMFLLNLYLAWRPLEGLSVTTPYREGKLGYPPHSQSA